MRSSQDRSLRRRDETRADSYRNVCIELLILICSIMRLRDQNCVNRETSYHLRTAHPRPDAEPAGGAVGSGPPAIRTRQTSSVLVAVLALAVSFRLEYLIFPASTPIALLLQELPRFVNLLSISYRFVGVVELNGFKVSALADQSSSFSAAAGFCPLQLCSRSLTRFFATAVLRWKRIDSLPVSTMWQ